MHLISNKSYQESGYRAVDKALKYEGLKAVIGELAQLSLTVSRRLQSAIQQSKVTDHFGHKNWH